MNPKMRPEPQRGDIESVQADAAPMELKQVFEGTRIYKDSAPPDLGNSERRAAMANQLRQRTQGVRLTAYRTSRARRGCAFRSVSKLL